MTIQKLSDVVNCPSGIAHVFPLTRERMQHDFAGTNLCVQSLSTAVMHTFVHSVSDFWNTSHIQSDPSFYRKRIGFILDSISREKNQKKPQKTEPKKKPELFYTIIRLLQTIQPFQNIISFA